MEYNLTFIKKKYNHGWSVWINRDGKKLMLGSAIKTEEEVYELVRNISFDKKLNLSTVLEDDNFDASSYYSKLTENERKDIFILMCNLMGNK